MRGKEEKKCISFYVYLFEGHIEKQNCVVAPIPSCGSKKKPLPTAKQEISLKKMRWAHSVVLSNEGNINNIGLSRKTRLMVPVYTVSTACHMCITKRNTINTFSVEAAWKCAPLSQYLYGIMSSSFCMKASFSLCLSVKINTFAFWCGRTAHWTI